MSNVITYQFPTFQIIQDGENVITLCNDGAACRVWVNDEDEKHAVALGITSAEHKLLHEIAHNLLAFAMGAEICPIVRAQCLLQPMPDNAKALEDMIMALSYAALKKPMLNAYWWECLGKVQFYGNPFDIADNIYLLFTGVEIEGVTIKTT